WDAIYERIMARIDLADWKGAQADIDFGKALPRASKWFTHAEATLAQAQNGPEFKPSFTKESDNYVIHTDVSQDFANWCSHQAELVRKTYNNVFKGINPQPAKRQYHIYIYGDEKRYHAEHGEDT